MLALAVALNLPVERLRAGGAVTCRAREDRFEPMRNLSRSPSQTVTVTTSECLARRTTLSRGDNLNLSGGLRRALAGGPGRRATSLGAQATDSE